MHFLRPNSTVFLVSMFFFVRFATTCLSRFAVFLLLLFSVLRFLHWKRIAATNKNEFIVSVYFFGWWTFHWPVALNSCGSQITLRHSYTVWIRRTKILKRKTVNLIGNGGKHQISTSWHRAQICRRTKWNEKLKLNANNRFSRPHPS